MGGGMWRRKALAQAVVIEQLTQELERARMQIGKLVADHKMHGALMLELERMRWKLSDAHLKAAEDYKRVDSLERVRKSLEAQIALLESRSSAGREVCGTTEKGSEAAR